jgi:hypothetical protein
VRAETILELARRRLEERGGRGLGAKPLDGSRDLREDTADGAMGGKMTHRRGATRSLLRATAPGLPLSEDRTDGKPHGC